jgi:outer membrane protein OmpA-like peptidoglycan-associated protein
MIRWPLLIGVLISFSLSAQLAVTISDDFSSNKLGWYEGDKVKVRNGHYEMDAPEDGWMAYIFPHINTEKDFSLEATFTQTEGKTDNGFGFIWGYDKSEKYNLYIVSTNGYFQAYTTDEVRADAKEWVETKLVKPFNQANRLKVEQIKGQLKFYLNGQIVSTMPAFPWFGKTLGFVCYTKMKFYIDDFVFAQEEKLILPANMKKGLVKENLGAQVNSKYDEVTPKITVDGKMLLFGRKFNPTNLGGENDGTDIWVSYLKEGNVWGPAQNLGKPVNSESVDNIISISQDNNSILVALAHDFKTYERSESGWRDGGNLGIYYEDENEFFEACQSADGKAILFTAENKQNLYYKKQESEKDIYVILKDQSGKWSKPVNLGAKVNSSGDETSPFLAADGRTLYFATDGRPGYGGQDIFMTKRIGDGWTNWTAPVNLGPEINTFSFDAYYTVPASGEYAYMVSSTGGYGLTDLIRVKLPKEIKPDAVVLVYGKVLNSKTNQPIEADIRFENLSTGKEAGEAISDPKTGEYRIALPYGTTYGFRAVADGFLSVNENIALNQLDKNYKEVKEDLLLTPIEIGQAIQLQNVFFIQGKSELKPESYPELDRLVEILKNNPAIEIALSGHTDNRGDISANYDLSDDRVKAVMTYLSLKGIDKNRMTGKGYGGSHPMVPNDTDEHREMNRRVEFKIMKK